MTRRRRREGGRGLGDRCRWWPCPTPPCQTDDATAGSATLAEVYEELGETDFDALETALRKCDADEEDIAAVHAVLDRAGRKEEVGD